MTNSLSIVEGAHDATFFGRLLRARGYVEIRTLDKLSEPWRGLVPSQYPTRSDGRLDRVVAYPNVFNLPGSDHWVGIAVAGGEANMIETLRVPIEMYDIAKFTSIGMAYDVDWQLDPSERFRRIIQRIENWSQEEFRDGLAGFPIALPHVPGEFAGVSTKFGVHLFPGSGRQGTIETLLLECAKITLPKLFGQSKDFVGDVKKSGAQTYLDEFNKPSGMDKCQAAVIAAVLFPTASLAVSVYKSEWLSENALKIDDIKQADLFIERLLRFGKNE